MTEVEQLTAAVPTDCECERWRDGATWCPYHGVAKPPADTNEADILIYLARAEAARRRIDRDVMLGMQGTKEDVRQLARYEHLLWVARGGAGSVAI